jgi:hypothetical protein
MIRIVYLAIGIGVATAVGQEVKELFEQVAVALEMLP